MTQLLSSSRPLSELRARLEVLAPALPAGLSRAILWTWAIAGGFGVALKAQRVGVHPERLSFDKQLALLIPELAFGGAMACAALLLAIGACRLRRPGLALAATAALAILTVLLNMLSHGYFIASGQPLDYAMFAFSLARADERIGVVASVSDGAFSAAVVGVLLVVALLPFWLWRRSPRTAAAAVSRRWAVLALVLACLGCLALTGYSPVRRIERGFARDPVTALALGFVRSRLPDTRYHGTPSRLRKTGAKDLQARAGASRRNVVVIMLESTRADATTTYAPTLRTTPFLERFAREGVVVERAYAVVPHTTKALVAILCGFEPEVTLSTIESQPGGLPGRCLPSLLAAEGYDTAFFQAPTGRFEDRRMLADNLGFATFISGDEAPRRGLERINYFGFEDAIMLEPSERWLEARRGRPFLAAYLTSAAHHPYGYPKRHETKPFNKNRAKNKYLNAVNYTDTVVERIVDQYRKLSLLEETVFVIVGDHGEAFGEHGLYFHDDVMFEEALRVPLVFRLPHAEQAGRRIPGPLSETAIVPTLISLAGFEARDDDYEQGNVFEFPSQPVVYAHCYRSDRCAAVLRDGYKLIDHFEERPAELYALARDPQEETDLADDHPERVERWSRELADVRLAVHATYGEASARALSRFVHETAPEIPEVRQADFGDYLSLRGVRLPDAESIRDFGKGNSLRFFMTYYWYVHRRIPAGFTIRLQLRGEGGSVTSQHRPLRGLMTVQDFPAGRFVEDTHRFSLPDRWESPSLSICMSLVDDRGAYVPVTEPGKPPATCAPITTVRVHRD